MSLQSLRFHFGILNNLQIYKYFRISIEEMTEEISTETAEVISTEATEEILTETAEEYSVLELGMLIELTEDFL